MSEDSCRVIRREVNAVQGFSKSECRRVTLPSLYSNIGSYIAVAIRFPKSSNGTDHHVDQIQREYIERKDVRNASTRSIEPCTESTLFSPSSHSSKSFTSSGWTLANNRVVTEKLKGLKEPVFVNKEMAGMNIRINAEFEKADVFKNDRDSLVGNRESNSASKFPKSPIPLSPEDISILESGILTISGNEIRAEASDQTDLWLAERAFRGVLQEGFDTDLLLPDQKPVSEKLWKKLERSMRKSKERISRIKDRLVKLEET
ncbi:hypothetical protein WN51_06490 [Melipona quadrifasciata]|uniref:Uncharacterized protein n=1 Tax=Melipona quadrifasciata TaxID=166423 RepID=A0A0N0U3F9_9HYME|nr:hypothetical protein WN51_06490 [Melipona quadrifasciata]